MPLNDAFLSLDSATSLMGTAPANPGTASWTTNGHEPQAELPPEKDAPAPIVAEDAPPAEPGAATETPPAPAAGDEPTPVQDDAPASADGGDEPGSLPPIEPPSGWNAEEQEAFKASPRKVQEAILRREQDRTTELRNIQNATAEQRKAADGEVARLKTLSDKIASAIKDEVTELARDFPELKTQADIEALAANDPARFAQFQARMMRFNANQQAADEAQRELQRKADAQNRETMKKAHDALVQIFPTWKDAEVAKKGIAELQDYAISVGASPEGARALHDPIIYKLAHKAMLYDRAQAARAAAVNRDPPRTVNKPVATSSTPKADKAAASTAAAMQKLSRSGDIEDALALMTIK